MQDLNIAFIQTALHWQDKAANFAMFEQKLAQIKRPVDLIVLPEMFTTGFTMNAAELAETMAGPTVQWLLARAREKNADIIGSAIIRENGKYFNRLLWARPNGACRYYDKRHLFRMAGEEKVYSAGTERLIVELQGWKICPFVCYDLRFPVWTRNSEQEYDVAIFVANWPEKRAAHWRLLLQARAVENLAYVVGVNRTGMDGNGYMHSGDSMVLDPRGELLFQARYVELMQSVTLSHKVLAEYRQSFPAWMDADKFEVLNIPEK